MKLSSSPLARPAPGDIIPVQTLPRASHNHIDGWISDAAGQQWLKVRITCAPEDGKANRALLKLLAKAWDVPVSSLEILSGDTSRHKRVRYRA